MCFMFAFKIGVEFDICSVQYMNNHSQQVIRDCCYCELRFCEMLFTHMLHYTHLIKMKAYIRVEIRTKALQRMNVP